MTLCAAVFRHLCSELSFVEIRVTRFTTNIGEMEHEVIYTWFPVARFARHRDMGTGKREPGFGVLAERERRRLEPFHGVAKRAVV
jgi:hypothetical protein